MARQDGTAHYLARIAPYRLPDGSTAGAIATFAAVTSVVRAAARQRTLIAELNHRVKNTLAVVLGIAASSLEASPARDAFVARVKALARAHELLAREGWSPVPLGEIIRAEAAPYQADGRDRFALSGPDLSVAPRVAQSLTIVLHEMATNAAKYGALSVEAGHVAVSWSVGRAGTVGGAEGAGTVGGADGAGRAAETDGAGEVDGVPQLVLEWRELDGPPAQPPERRGFGSRVIDREVRAGLHGAIEMEFGAAGLHARITCPFPPPKAGADPAA